MVRARNYLSHAEALEAAGLRESVLRGWPPAHCATALRKNAAPAPDPVLLPEGLLRLSLGLRRTLREARRADLDALREPTVSEDPLLTKKIDTEEIPGLVAARRRNRCIPRERITEARLRNGRLNSRLAVVLPDGSRIKLLWLKADPASEVLPGVLGEWLGDRLVMD